MREGPAEALPEAPEEIKDLKHDSVSGSEPELISSSSTMSSSCQKKKEICTDLNYYKSTIPNVYFKYVHNIFCFRTKSLPPPIQFSHKAQLL